MAERVCLVHYHEIGLKGKNRAYFERILMDNLEAALAAFSVAAIERISGYILVRFRDASCIDSAAATITKVPGVARVSRAWRCPRDVSSYGRAAIEALHEFGPFGSFKVHARRSNTDFELGSLELNRQVGEILCEAFPEHPVDVHTPDATVYVLVVQGSVYVYAKSMRGIGGLPEGSAGKVVTLLSSGIDSPVATWMMARRGAIPVPIHFSGRPQTADTSEYLVEDIIRALAPAVQIGRLYVVPFGDAQREISIACPNKLRVIMYRRVMYAMAERIARIEGARAIVTGESLGQVASQTLENIMAVDEVVHMPVFRPLIGSDKQEIIIRAEEINTFDISTQTAPDCCTLFMPKKPETHARPDEVHEAWEAFDHQAMIESLLEHIEYLDFDAPRYKPPRMMRERHDTLRVRDYVRGQLQAE
ncbi:tRNA 4-thiouridine(8) synthase ThiI [Collinsella sp. zg1085]|uniref:tRNA uracil 4-sulfurtransferase ThiI n=1 Tax=Collinsella sp. zg1085 TaxID=2844380 RepID=UPI001C0E3561|nr:tRNA uracil 4-sulfurtransferase ThiI [Collinsella sp. zg1085]QWT16972.1 tRNA 4-thiouridine(8) synthase ThiI [Collinsella sp. zg1085]